MQKNLKRLLSLFLTLVLLAGLLPPVSKASAATATTEESSDMLANATYAWSSQDWTGNGQFSYSNNSTVTNGADSLRSWSFSSKANTSSSYARLQIDLKENYDMSGKDLVFDVKADPAKDLSAYSIGIVPYGSDWKPVHDYTDGLEYQVYFKGSDWTTVKVDNSILKAYLESGKDLSSIRVLYLSFKFPAGGAQNIYIDNMRLEDHSYGTDETDAAADLLANATVVSNDANGSTYTYEHANKTVAYGNSSNSSHKFAAAANATNMLTVKYDLGKSYDLNNKNVVLDMLSYRGGNGFAFSLYNSQNQLVSYAECYTTVNQWAQVRPAILAGLQSGKNLSDVRYIAIGARFAANTARADRAFYVDNVRIENIDVHATALQDKNIVFMGDSITASYGYKGWSGELEEHYLINKYNIGVGGASFATCDGRTTIYAQKDSIPNVDVDFFVLNGGVNDVWSKLNLGSVSSIPVANATVNSFDTNTTAGAMEQMFCYLRKNYPNAKIGFLINYICYEGAWDGVAFRDEFAPLAKQICEKWGVSCLDMSTDTTFNGLYGIHTYDGVHGNDVGYEIVMRKMAPWLISLCDATEQTEQNSDLLAYATYAWSESTWNSGALSYDNTSTDVSGSESLRSWKFSATSAQTSNAGIQLQLDNLDIFTLTGKKLQFDVKFEGAAQKIGLRLYDKNWKSLTGTNVVWAEGNGAAGWQTLTVDASQFESVLASGCSLDDIRLIAFEFEFATNKGSAQTVTVDNFRTVSVTATEATEQASDLLYGAGFVEGSMAGEGLGYDQFNTTFLKGKDSKYSLRFFAEDDKTAWGTATFKLPKSIDLRETTLQFNVNQYNQAALWVDLYDSNYKKITGDNYTLRAIGWQTYEVNTLFGLESGRTAEDLKDVRYIQFSLNLDPANTGRTVVIDNLSTYSNVKYDSAISGLTGLYLGDSISEAHNYKGWPGEMAEHYGVNGYNVSVGGRTLANDGIYSELANVPADMQFDFVMLNGVVNDYFASIATGTLTPDGTTTFDGTTAIGGLEKLFHAITTRYPDAEVVYILNFVPDWSSFRKTEYLNDFIPQAKKACEKWGVHCLDLVDNDPFLAEFDVTADVHTFDGLHPNKEGFDVITPYVVSFLESIFDQSSVEAYWTLEQDETVDLSLSEDLYVDLNGHNLTGIIQTNGYKVYVIDSATDRYTCNNMGYFNCVDTQGNAVAPEAHLRSYKNGTIKRYLSIPTEDGYTLHRFYVGITKQSLAPSVTGVGYKAEFHGDDMVKAMLNATEGYGYKLWLDGHGAITRSKAGTEFVSGNELTLRIKNFDAENYGETPVHATAWIKLSDGTVIESAQYSVTLRQMVESVNENYKAYSETQLQATRDMIAANPVMENWEIANIIKQAVLRGEAFEGGVTKTILLPENATKNLSFDYKLTTDGDMRLILRAPDWNGFYGDFTFDANGLVWSYQTGITTEKLEDGYIRVHVNFAELNRSGCLDNLNSAPASVGVFDIYSWGTANGYVDNIQLDVEQPEEEVIRGEAFNGNDGKIIYLDENAYESITFDYKLTNDGTIRLLLRDIDAWTTGVYGDFFFDAAGETMDYAGITSETLPDGYIRVTINFAQLNRTCLVDNRDGAPDKVGVFDIYSGNTGDGYIDNIQLDVGVSEEDVIRGEAFEGGVTKTILLPKNATENLSFDYKLTTDGDIRLVLRAPDWNGFYGDFTFDANGLVWSYQTGITTEKLDDGYIRVHINFAELNRSGCLDNLDSAPASVGVFDIYSWGTADGYVDNIQLDVEESEEEVIRGEVYNAGEKTNYMITEGDYATISFEYKLTTDGFIRVMLRSPSDTECYGSFYFTAEGEREDYTGVVCEKLSDGYIRVTVTTAEVSITGNSEGREKVPATVSKVCVYRDSTASGYIDNIQFTEKDPSEESYRGTGFIAGATSNVTLSATVFEEISFEYILTTAGQITVALRSPTDVPYYGLYYFDANGLVTENNAGVYTEKLDDGYVRVKMVLAELGITNSNNDRENVPETVSKLVFYKFGTANGYVDNVELKLPPPERGDALVAGQDWSYSTDAAAYEQVMVDYRLTGGGQVAFALTDATASNYYGYYYFDANGEIQDYAGVSTMTRSDEFTKITFNIAELAKNSGVAPSKIAKIMVIGSESTATGFVDYVQFKKSATPTGVRFGVLSDVHVGAFEDDQYTVRLIHALTAYRDRGVDAILISGDLQNHTTDLELSKKWIEIFADAWFSVFPDNTNPVTGEHVEPVLICGNHDQQLVAEKYWPERFGEYTDAFIKEVNGYYFVGANFWCEEAATSYISYAKEDSNGYPFFYTQHCTLYNTVYGITDSGHGTAETNLKSLWDAYNAITFTGHTHIPATDERSIWQSLDDKRADFTAVQVPSLNYGRLADLGLTAPGNYDLCEQGMYVEVEGSDVTITRLDFADHDNVLGEQLGEKWSFDAADPTDRPYDYDLRASEAGKPEFAEDAEITVDFLSKTQITITVPTATVTAPEGFSDAIQLYYVELVKVATGEIVQTDLIETDYLYDLKPERFDGPFSTTFFGLEDNTEYQVRVYAREFYQVQSEPVTLNFNTAQAPADVIRGQQFTAETSTYIAFEAGAYETISFDYRVTGVGEMVIVLRSTDWIPYYGTFNFNASGEAVDYEGIECQRLNDNFIRVTMSLAELNRTNNNDDRLNAPGQVQTIDIYSWTTVNGYFDNLKLYKEGETPESPVEPEEPEVVMRGEQFAANVGTNIAFDNAAYSTISFDYKLTGEGTMSVILRDTDNWTSKVYGDYTFNATGLVYAYGNYQSGITCELLEDGYVHVTMKLSELQRSGLADNRNAAPKNVGVLDIYSWTNVDGYIDNVQCVAAEEHETLLLLQKCNGTNASCSARDYSNVYFSTTPFTSANDTLTLVVKTDCTSIKLRGMSNLGDEWSGTGVTKNFEDLGDGWKKVTFTLSEIVGSNDVTTMNGFRIDGLVEGMDILMKDILINGQTDWIGEYASNYHGVVTLQ